MLLDDLIAFPELFRRFSHDIMAATRRFSDRLVSCVAILIAIVSLVRVVSYMLVSYSLYDPPVVGIAANEGSRVVCTNPFFLQVQQ